MIIGLLLVVIVITVVVVVVVISRTLHSDHSVMIEPRYSSTHSLTHSFIHSLAHPLTQVIRDDIVRMQPFRRPTTSTTTSSSSSSSSRRRSSSIGSSNTSNSGNSSSSSGSIGVQPFESDVLSVLEAFCLAKPHISYVQVKSHSRTENSLTHSLTHSLAPVGYELCSSGSPSISTPSQSFCLLLTSHTQ